MSNFTNSFHENLINLMEEISLAIRWERGIIIFTVHKSIFSQNKIIDLLQKKLQSLNFGLVIVDIYEVGNNFIDFIIKREKSTKNTIFIISNLNNRTQNNGEIYKLLNMHREFFIEHNLKVILLLSEQEGSEIPIFAPDFWAFRHRVFYFGRSKIGFQNPPPVEILNWGLSEQVEFINAEEKISRIKELLIELPKFQESISIRNDLIYELAYLYWLIGKNRLSKMYVLGVIKQSEKFGLFRSLIKFKLGFSILHYENGDFSSAFELLNSQYKTDKQDGLIMMNLGIVLFALNKKYDGINKAKGALKLDPESSQLWNSLGFLHFYNGNFEEAMMCFDNSIKKSPSNLLYLESIAVCYFAMGKSKKAISVINLSRNKNNERKKYLDFIELAINESEKFSQEQPGKLFMENNNTSKFELLRNPNIKALLDIVPSKSISNRAIHNFDSRPEEGK